MENYKEYFDNIISYSGLDLVKSNKKRYLKDEEKDIYVKYDDNKMGIIANGTVSEMPIKILIERRTFKGGYVTITMEESGETEKAIISILDKSAIIVKASKKRLVTMLHSNGRLEIYYPDKSKNRIVKAEDYSYDEIVNEIVYNVINAYNSIEWVYDMTDLSNIITAISKVFVSNLELGWRDSLKIRENSLKSELIRTASEIKAASDRYNRSLNSLNDVNEAIEAFNRKDQEKIGKK